MGRNMTSEFCNCTDSTSSSAKWYINVEVKPCVAMKYDQIGDVQAGRTHM
jgi:hypothetical protein